MKQLFLVSTFQNVTHLFKKVEPKLKKKSIAYIPTAARVENVKGMAEAELLTLSNLGMTATSLDISSVTYEKMDRTLSESDFIFVSGGNTFFLLQELKRTGADKLLLREIKEGKLYIGESAGAIITSPDITYSSLMDQPEKAPLLTDYSALNLVPFYIVPHVKSSFLGKEAEMIKDKYDSCLDLKFLTEHQALWIKDEKVTLF